MLYTIGYAAKTVEEFVLCLRKYQINIVIDVRSIPYSKYYDRYDKENVEAFLQKENIKYFSFAKEFGAKREDSAVCKSIVDYDGKEKMVMSYIHTCNTPEFQLGVKQVLNMLKDSNNKICLMCSEEDPFNCHRSIMLAQYFYEKGFDCLHIIDLNSSLKHEELYPILQDNFEKSKKRYLKARSKNKFDPFFWSWWNQFFSEYSLKKGIFIRNLQLNSKDVL